MCLLCLSALAWATEEGTENPSPTAQSSGADPAHQRTFRIMLSQSEKIDRYDALILRYSQNRRLNPRLVKSVIAAESGFYKGALSPKGARGLMQILPRTAEEMGVNPEQLRDPESNLRAGTAYLSWLYRTAWKAYGLEGVSFRDGPPWAQRRVIAAYNGGPRQLYRRQWPRQTQLYVREVMLYYRSPVTTLRARRLPLAPALPSAALTACFPEPEGPGRKVL